MARLEPEAPARNFVAVRPGRARQATRSSRARRSPADKRDRPGPRARRGRPGARRSREPRDAARQPARQRAALHARRRPHRRRGRRRAAAGRVLPVIDTGPGIPAAERERVFERFHRGTQRVAARRAGRQRPRAVDRAAHRRRARRHGRPGRRPRRPRPCGPRALSRCERILARALQRQVPSRLAYTMAAPQAGGGTRNARRPHGKRHEHDPPPHAALPRTLDRAASRVRVVAAGRGALAAAGRCAGGGARRRRGRATRAGRRAEVRQRHRTCTGRRAPRRSHIPVGQRRGRHAERARAAADAKGAALDAEGMARAHLRDVAAVYAIAAAEIDALPMHNLQRFPNGSAVVRFRGQVDGIEVFREQVNVLLDARGGLVAVGGFAMGAPDGPCARARRPSRPVPRRRSRPRSPTTGSIARSWNRCRRPATPTAMRRLALPAAAASDRRLGVARAARVKRVWFRLPGELVPRVVRRSAGAGRGVAARASTTTRTSCPPSTARCSSGTTRRRTPRSRTASTPSPCRAYLPLPGPGGPRRLPASDRHARRLPAADWWRPISSRSQSAPFSRNDPWLLPNATEDVSATTSKRSRTAGARRLRHARHRPVQRRAPGRRRPARLHELGPGVRLHRTTTRCRRARTGAR